MASDNKTYIPGVDYSDQNTGSCGIDSLYSRSMSSSHDRNKTFVPDMYRQMNAEIESNLPQKDEEITVKLQDRNIVGILFSISHHSRGEIFPVYIGRNTIGSSDDSDICLHEKTVSPNHAVLLVRENSNLDGSSDIVVTLTDYDSEYGSKVGDEQLLYDKVTCQDHSIISIGNAYQFILSILNPSMYGLRVCSDFADTTRIYERNMDSCSNEESRPVSNHDANIVSDIDDFDFYAPTKKQGDDHSKNKTVVL